MTNTTGLRLAFRLEGNRWNCYVTKTDTMKGAIWMGAMATGIVINNKEHKEAFMDLMKSVFETVIKEKGISVDFWNEAEAPESERSGSA